MSQGFREMLANRRFAIPLIVLLAFCFIGLILVGIVLILRPGDGAPVAQATTPAATATRSQPVTFTPSPTATPLPTDISSPILPESTATSSSTPSPTPTATATPQPTPSPSPTPSPEPPPSTTPSPTPSPSPAPTSPGAAGRPWVLTSILILGLIGAAVAAGRRTTTIGSPQEQESPDVPA